MRNGISFPAFAEIAKHTFVEAAMAPDVHSPFRTTSARTALLTKRTHLEVCRMRKRRSHRACPQSAGWVRDALFLDGEGRPIAPTERGSSRRFGTLIQRFRTDIPRARLREAPFSSG